MRRTNFPRQSGIYMIQSIVNNKQYVGSAVNLKNRKGCHIRSLKRDHNNRYMQNHVNKHGIDVLRFFILEFCLEEELIEREQYWMDVLNPEFNLCPTAGSMFGFRFSEESKRKMSESHADYSGENHPRFGSRHSEESKQKSSKTKKVFYQTEEGLKVRKKLSDYHKGLKHSEETKRKIGASGKGRIVTKEARYKISEGNKGKKMSEESKQKNRESQIKRMTNPELRQRHREAALKQWQDPEWRKNHVGVNYRKGIRKQKII